MIYTWFIYNESKYLFYYKNVLFIMNFKQYKKTNTDSSQFGLGTNKEYIWEWTKMANLLFQETEFVRITVHIKKKENTKRYSRLLFPPNNVRLVET